MPLIRRHRRRVELTRRGGRKAQQFIPVVSVAVLFPGLTEQDSKIN